MRSYKIAILITTLTLVLSACGGGDGGDPSPPPEPGLEAADEISLDLTRDWYVETTGDDANFCTTIDIPCLTIRGALTQSTLGDRIHAGAGTYVEPGMSGAILPINHSISIIGAGPGLTIIDADNNEGGIFLSPGTSATNVHLEDFTIQNTMRGSASGCIDNRSPSSLTVENVEMRNCWRTGFVTSGTGLSHLTNVYIHDSIDEETTPEYTLNGNGIVSRGNLIVESSEIANNESNGIVIFAGTVNLSATTVTGNQGYGISLQEGVVANLDNVTVHNNAQRGVGTGLFIRGASVEVTASDFFENVNAAIFAASGTNLRLSSSSIHNEPVRALHVADGATVELDEVIITNNGDRSEFHPTIWASGTLTILRSEISANRNIAIYIDGSSRTTLYDTDISNNIARRAAIVMQSTTQLITARTLISNNDTGSEAALSDSGGILIAVNLTVSNNSGLGLSSRSPFNISYSTIAENGADGFYFDGVGGILSDNIIASNDGADCTFPSIDLVLGGTNIDSDDSCAFAETYTAAELLLGSLADNGGLTQTHALAATSPAVDAASSLTCPRSDQRSFARPAVPNCDVGAYEISDTMIAIEAIEAAEETPDLIEIFTPTPESDPSATAIQNASCRKGADPAFEVVNFLFEGQTALLLGRMTEGSWFYLELPDELGRCWVFAENLTLTGPIDQLPFFTPPELPAPDEGSGDDGGGDDAGGNDGGGGGTTAPNAPTNASITNRTCSGQDYYFTIVWHDNSDNEDGFRILRDGVLIATVGPNVESYQYTPPGSGPYTFTIEAFNGAGVGKTTVQEPVCFV
jgi:hypothetical protein